MTSMKSAGELCKRKNIKSAASATSEIWKYEKKKPEVQVQATRLRHSIHN